jgi:ATP-dependent helicase/nuclease subunit A
VDKILDADERAQALDVTRSFIVQAPAGSGKTELLTQRLLTLLGKACDEPEQLIAITFTRKAAAEMRKRLLSALEFAQTQPAPTAAHALTTWQLAKDVLAIDAKRGWQLLQNPNRLRIQTIDALCAAIARSAPYLSQFGAEPKILDNPQACYQKAARGLMKQLAEDTPWQPALARLLLHLDNDWNSVQQLLTSMLARRDQWLPHLVGENDLNAKRQRLERSLENVISDTLKLVSAKFPSHLQNDLLSLLRYAGEVLSVSDPNNIYGPFLNISDFPGAQLHDRELWDIIANFLLVQTGSWRKAFNANMGFLAPSATKVKAEREERQQVKSHLQDFMSAFAEAEDLRQLLMTVQLLPPAKYTEDQWQILADLVILLPILSAELQWVFREQGGVDFIEVATRARQALGSADNPTEIALNWDYRIRHLLVDEFQDTATPQYHLLELLTAGWQANDGRTLFLVGDPMQSIYRFREAEVGLFLRAQQHGLGDISLTTLQLQVNFRSQVGLIEWVNRCFVDIFPGQNAMSVGAVSYSPSHAADQTAGENVCIHPLLNNNTEEEAQRVVEIIAKTQREDATARTVILVRARHHANAIILALQRAEMRYQAQDMEKLSYRAVIQDLFALTRALLHPADRIAWLAILRAPWCGVSLADLLVLTQQAKSGSLWPHLQAFAVNSDLSADAAARLRRCVPILSQALAERGRQPLRRWLQTTWQDLSGPVCITNNADFQNAQRYFALLEKCPSENIYDFSYLENQLNNLYATVDPVADDRLQIMTMHKAKGLEFDVVILPALERSSMTDKQQLLLWWERPRLDGEADLILGPIKPTNSASDPIYSYLRSQESLKTQYEMTRVLYVAATRAKKTLHLIGSITPTGEQEIPVASDSFLGMLWPHIQQHFFAATQANTASMATSDPLTHRIRRLSADFSAAIHSPISLKDSASIDGHESNHQDYSSQSEQIAFRSSNGSGRSFAYKVFSPNWEFDQTAEHIGTVIHRTFEQIVNDGLQLWQTKNLSECHTLWRNQLQQLGIPHDKLNSSIEIIAEAITKTLNDERGRWILSPHADHRSEYPLTLVQNNEIVHCIIDRTFIDNAGHRWIIDYKASLPKPEQSPTDFLQAAHTFHAPQLNRYAEAFSHLEQRPIQLALYFPRCGLYHSWAGSD